MPESKLVDAIVEDVLRKLNRGSSSNFIPKGLIGIERQIKEIKSLLSVSSPNVCIVGIWGMGGMGKTTLAQVIFNQLSSEFEACSFVANVREESEKGSLINLRNKLLSELLREENLNVGTPSLGPTFVKERLERTKVLIVLDDVNHVEQLNFFVGDRDQFCCESRIVVTTRDAMVLRLPYSIGACCPGYEIPKWFEYQSEGSFIDIKLPLERQNFNFLGIVFCVVGYSYSDIELLVLRCEVNLKANQGENREFTAELCGALEVCMKFSSNVWMWSVPGDYYEWLNAVEASFDSSIIEWGETSKHEVKKCGIHLVNQKEIEEFRFNFINVGQHHVLEEAAAE